MDENTGGKGAGRGVMAVRFVVGIGFTVLLLGLFFHTGGWDWWQGWAYVGLLTVGQTVRIQTDRAHRVCTRGPYRFVRHPGYVGAALGFPLAAPLLLGSAWALAAAVVCVGTLVLRTALEDRTLRAELDGYEAFTRQTRWRLVPGVW